MDKIKDLIVMKSYIRWGIADFIIS